jgi:hypothetical protein
LQRRYEKFTAALIAKGFTPERRAREISAMVRAHGELFPAILTKLRPDCVRNEREDLKRDGEVMARMIEFDASEPIRRIK